MRIVQIIDSLEVGGAEKMAVNYANALADKIAFSGLIATRKEGALKKQIHSGVHYFFLEKKKTLDFAAALRLKKYCKANRIEILHAHASSYFIALMVKLLYPKIKIIWHDHNGLSDFITKQKRASNKTKIPSYFFKGIIVVNYKLKEWAQEKLWCNNVIYLANFTNIDNEIHYETFLEGKDGKRILCLANLRPQKNHFLLLEVAERVAASHPDWTFHLVGKDFNDDYSAKIKLLIKEKKLEHSVFVYGTKNDIPHIISQSDIGVLTSDSEGLPVALIEYGLLSKPVVTTKVGEIPMIINDGLNGYLTNVNNALLFYDKLLPLLNDIQLRKQIGHSLYKTISENHSEEMVIKKYLNWINYSNGKK